MDGIKSMSKKDPRHMSPPTPAGRDRTLNVTASEKFATGKNAYEEDTGSAGKSYRPGKTRGHGGS